MENHFLYFLFSICNVAVLGQFLAPVVNISDGQLVGTANFTVGQNRSYFAYRGIPFAQKPIGNLRFAAPVKNEPWTGTLNATQDKDSCTQISGGSAVAGGSVVGSEDCLYINVYTTNLTGNLPVMVWVYGGGFSAGTSAYSTYGPDYLLEKDVVYVSFNYRLGVFGFLSTEDLVAPGNWGLKDQVLALKWVRDNIKSFGGNPDKVTVFGQSAGGASVSYLTHSPQTKGLFNGAILQSGSSLCLWALSRNAREIAFRIGLRLGIFSLTTQRLVNELRKVDFRTLKLADNNVSAQSLLTDNILAGLPLGPVTEPEHSDAFFSGSSWDLLSKGDFGRVPMIIGQVSNEAASLKNYINYIRPYLVQYELSVSRFAPFDLTQNYFARLAAGTAVRVHYFGLGSISGQGNNLTKFINVDQFERPLREEAVLVSNYSTVYYYDFTYKGLLGDPNNTLQGVGHAEELNYLFRLYLKSGPINGNDRATVDKFTTLWTNFAKTGNPTSSNGGTLGNVTWVPNNSNSNSSVTFKYLEISTNLSMKTNPFQDDWNFYEDLYNRYGVPPYSTY